MTLDLRTLVVLCGLGHLLQVLALALQFAINRSYRGIGWWLAWSATVAAGFGFTLLRGVPSLRVASILGQNFLVVLGLTFLYVGLVRFLGRTARWRLLGPILAGFALAFPPFLFVTDDIVARSLIVCATLALLSFLVAWDLHAGRTGAIAASARFVEVVLLANGLFFTVRAVMLPGSALDRDFFRASAFNLAPFLDGFVVGNLLTLGVILMVNQRSHAEMTEARDHFQLLFDTSPDAVLITRIHDGVCRNVNQGFEALTGFRPEEILGRSAVDLQLYEEPADREEVVARLRETGTASNIEIPFHRRDGTPFVGSMSARIIELQGVPHIISVTRDVSDRKRAEEAIERNAREIRDLNLGLEKRVAERTAELTEANLELEALIHSIAHDLRAPLRAVDGFSAILEEEHAGRLDAEGLRLLGRLRKGAQTMDRLIRDLLEYARTGTADLRPVPVDMASLAQSIFLEAASAELRRSIDFSVGALPQARGDAALLSVVLRHLISNAIKYTVPRQERRIEVGGVCEGDWATYHVSDNGVGFNPAHASKLFGMFQRLHAGDVYDGTGIGLAIVKRIVERHGGRVWAEGTPNEGARIFFTMPRGERNA